MSIDHQLRVLEVRLWQVRKAAYIGFALSGFLFLFGIVVFGIKAKFVVTSFHEQGQVTQVIRTDDDDRVSYKFQDAYGRVQSGSGSCRRGAHHVGDSIDLLCEVPERASQKPVRSEIAGFMNQWGFATMLLSCGAIILIGALRLQSYWKKMRMRFG